MNPAKKRTYKP
ncbi:hypothetical protein EE612_043812 [Oryza sativa]|nr:hypothetical protein EE612_043812 [Oryza sativa]